jgi:hypothetical protein
MRDIVGSSYAGIIEGHIWDGPADINVLFLWIMIHRSYISTHIFTLSLIRLQTRHDLSEIFARISVFDSCIIFQC